MKAKFVESNNLKTTTLNEQNALAYLLKTHSKNLYALAVSMKLTPIHCKFA